MLWLLIGLIGCFGFVLLVGAPYLPTLKPQLKTALDLMDLKPGQTMLELGCGDGRVLLAAADRGWQVVGYELNPLLFALCWVRTRRYRKQVRVYCRNFWTTEWPPADGIFAFALGKYMLKLDKKVAQFAAQRSVRLVSFAFVIPDRKPSRQIGGVYRYDYKN